MTRSLFLALAIALTDAVAAVLVTASFTVLNTGRPRCVCPPLPGVTPATKHSLPLA